MVYDNSESNENIQEIKVKKSKAIFPEIRYYWGKRLKLLKESYFRKEKKRKKSSINNMYFPNHIN